MGPLPPSRGALTIEGKRHMSGGLPGRWALLKGVGDIIVLRNTMIRPWVD